MKLEVGDVIELMEQVNGSFIQVADPKVRAIIVRALEAAAPLVNAAGPDAHAAYIAAKRRLQSPMEPLVSPRTGERFQV
jgi:hypothetical protein